MNIKNHTNLLNYMIKTLEFNVQMVIHSTHIEAKQIGKYITVLFSVILAKNKT